jgi:hypothetical protein
LAKAIGQCIGAGNTCLDHCLTILGTGDTSLAECGKAVRNMLAVCNATQILVTGQPGLRQAGGATVHRRVRGLRARLPEA